MTCAAPIDAVTLEAPAGPGSMMPPGMFLPERINAPNFNNLPAELIRIQSECGINFVVHFVQNASSASYVDNFLDRCQLNGFTAMIGFEDEFTWGGASWDISPVTTAIVPNRDHPAFAGFVSIDEPWELADGSTANLLVLYDQLKAAAVLPNHPIFLNLSGGIEFFQNSPTRQYEVGLGDIIGITNLPFQIAPAPLYDRETLYRRISYSRRRIMEIHEADGTPVPPIYSGIQAFGGDGFSRFPDPPEMLDSLQLQLSALLYSYGPLDRIMWQRWHQRQSGGTATVLRDTAAARHRDFIKIISERI